MSSRSLPWKPIVIAFVVVGLVLVARAFDISQKLKEALAWVEGHGTTGVIVFIVIYVAACVFFVPASLLTLGAGAVYGVIWGSIYVSIASTVGATCAFLVGRYLARDAIQRRIAGNAKFSAIDEAVGREGWKIVGLTRLSPVFSFTLLNYAYGLTRVGLRDYILASWIGMMPGTVMYIYIGSLAGDIATLGGERTRSTQEWVLYIVGLLATVVATVYVTKVARKAIAEKVA
jgi:uncharacterized membrane protein YdjX (TVP38/TMEM64 family)